MLERSDYSEHMVLLISDEAIDEKQLSDINEVPRKIEMYVTLFRRGQAGGLKLPGEWFNIGDTEGVLVTRETTNDLWWILSHPEHPGQYELKLSAIKEIPKEELVKIDRSVQSGPDVIKTIRIFKAGPPGSPPPTGGWALLVSEPHPTEIQEVFNPDDKMYLGLAIGERLASEVTFSRFTFFNKEAGVEEAVAPSPDDFGPFEPGQTFLLAFQEPWKVPDEDGEYEMRVYMGNDIVASALFNVGIWPASWGPEMVRRPAPIYEVRVNTSEEEPRVSVNIKGGLPQGCEASHGYSVEQLIDDTIYIKATIRHLKDAPCEDYTYFEETVNLWPGLLKNFNSGETYKINVNGYTTTFVMP